ncbi:Ger(x)C family spore germination protein [Paenibacillus protaetiae]|uniref:Ger(x)C family spore germination protein n=1 Tax=Paenibacillus protaetiae TaxID=2509456 RepID=UPI0013EA52B8|nr:Ger(x)C family spore germination protein [Paenibacillus protaetiae]
MSSLKAAVRCGIVLILLSGFLTSACSTDKLDLENASVPLALGLDLDENQKIHYYLSTPVFNHDIKKKSKEIDAEFLSLRQSRKDQDSMVSGSIQGRNYQVLLIGRKLIETEGWFQMLDVIYRDPRNTVTDRVIVVQGPVSDVIYFRADDQPPISVFLRSLIDSKSKNAETVRTTAQELHRQYFDRALTPAVSEIKLEEGRVKVTGTALLSHLGLYRTSLGRQETALLEILQGNGRPGLMLSYAIPGEKKTGPFATDRLSFTLGVIKTKIKSSYSNDKFHFQIKIKAIVNVMEELFPYNMLSQEYHLERQVEQQMKGQIESMLSKIQRQQIDPVGFGLYARAYQHDEFKKVQNDWGKALAKADFDVKVSIKIGTMGAISNVSDIN